MSERAKPTSLLISILLLAGPTMLEQLLQTAVQYIDTAMVGSLGTGATAAVGSTTTVNWLVNSTVAAVSVGFLAFISKAIGAGETSRVHRATAQAVLLTLVLGTALTGLTVGLSPFIPEWMQVDAPIRRDAWLYFMILYMPMLPRTATIIFGTVLRAAGDTKTPMLVGAAVNLVNVVLNFIFIFPTRTVTVLGHSFALPGLGMGVIGAATASAVAFTLGGVLIALALYKNSTVSPKGQSLVPDMSILVPCIRVALPNALQRFATSFGYVAFASMVNSLGDVATAAHTIANTVESAFYIPGYGMQTATATLSGNALGASDGDGLRRTLRTVLLLEVVLMVLSGGLLFILAPSMMGLFSRDTAVIAAGSAVLRMVALSEPFYGVYIILEGSLLGMGRTAMPAVTNIIGMWAVRIAGTALCIHVLGLGLESAWGCMILHNLLLFAVFGLYYLCRMRKDPLGIEKKRLT